MNKNKKPTVRIPAFSAFLLSFLALLPSCVKVELFNTTHPQQGQITLTTDWANRGTGVDVPASYTVALNNQMQTYTQATNILPLLDPGTYPTRIYNAADKITINGTTATVQTTGTAVDTQPGWLFTSLLDITGTADQDDDYTAIMQQQVRQLTIRLQPTEGTIDRITGIEGTLSGVASSLDFATGTHSNAANAPLTFGKDNDGYWSVSIRLLGITGTAQTLDFTMTFADGDPASVSVSSSLGSALTSFNADKKSPLTLDAIVSETPTPTGFEFTINDWSTTVTGTGDAK